MQDSANEDNTTNPIASEKLPLAEGSSSTALNEVYVTRYVSAVNCKCPPVSDSGVDDKDDKDHADVCDSWLPKLAADSTLVGSTDELTDGSGCMSLTEPSSSQMGSIVTVISQNHVTGDCFSNECSMDAAGGLKDSMQNSYGKDSRLLESAGKPNSQSVCDGGAGKSSVVFCSVFVVT